MLPAGGASSSSAASSAAKQKRAATDPWLHAWHDPVAGISTPSSCVRLADLDGDGDAKLLVADSDKKLKIFKGTALVAEYQLLDVPVALAAFYTDASLPRAPAIAVASGSFVFIYRNLRPYFKFTLPQVPVHAAEAAVWAQLRADTLGVGEAQARLADLRDNGMAGLPQGGAGEGGAGGDEEEERKEGAGAASGGARGGGQEAAAAAAAAAASRGGSILLTSRSQDLLALAETSPPGSADAAAFVASHKHAAPAQQTVATCMETLAKDSAEADAISCLVIGTEAGTVLVLDPAGSKVRVAVQLRGVPVLLAVTGLFDVDYRIVAACRDGCVYTIKNGKVGATPIELAAQPCALVRQEKQILVGCMDGTLHCYHIKGKKEWSLRLAAPISAMAGMRVERSTAVSALLVATRDGATALYRGRRELARFASGTHVTAMRFGHFGREEASLVLLHRNGSLTIKMLQRRADLAAPTDAPGPPPEQDVPLNIPSKTRLYVEQTQREREQATDMHRAFQRDLCRLRLNAARAYVKVIGDGHGVVAATGGGGGAGGAGGAAALRLTARVLGLGPRFRIKLSVQNVGASALTNVPLACAYNHAMYRLPRGLHRIPLLIPGLLLHHDIDVECVEGASGADIIRVLVCSTSSCVPLVSAVVQMPIMDAVA